MNVSEAYLLTQFDIQYISVFMVLYGMVFLIQYLMAFYLMFVKFSDCFPDNLFLLAASFVQLYGNEAEAGWVSFYIYRIPKVFKDNNTLFSCSLLTDMALII